MKSKPEVLMLKLRLAGMLLLIALLGTAIIMLFPAVLVGVGLVTAYKTGKLLGSIRSR